MRIPVNRLHGRARQREDTAEDALADQLSKTYTVLWDKALDFTDERGDTETIVFDLTIPSHLLIIEVQHKQDDKSIMAEMVREKVARANGWRICRLTEKEAAGPNVLSIIKQTLERPV